MYPQSQIRRRRVLTPPFVASPQTEDLLGQVEDNVLRRPRVVAPASVDPTAVVEQSRPTVIQPELVGGTPPFIAPQNIDAQAGFDQPVARRVVPMSQPVESNIDDSMIDGSVPITRPVQPIAMNSAELDTTQTRPRLVDPLADLQRKEEDIRLHPTKIGRGKAILLGALQGLAQGGIGGALGGAAVGAVSPDSIGRLRQQQELGEVNQQIDQRMQREGRIAQIDALKQRPAIAAAREARIGNQQQSMALSREQRTFLERAKLTGGYKRGQNPPDDAIADRLFGAGSLQDFDTKKNERARTVAGDGLLWEEDGTGNLKPKVNPQTGTQMASEGEISRRGASETRRATAEGNNQSASSLADYYEGQAKTEDQKAVDLQEQIDTARLGGDSLLMIDLEGEQKDAKRRAQDYRDKAQGERAKVRQVPQSTSGTNQRGTSTAPKSGVTRY